nr:hypothetical protein [Tanacetum cinerariifolium]
MERNLNHEQVTHTSSLSCSSREDRVVFLSIFSFHGYSFQLRISVLLVWTFFLHDTVVSLPCHRFLFHDPFTVSFSLSPIPVEDSDSFMEEIDLYFTPDDPMSSGIEEDDYDSERDILILEEFLSNDSLSLSENESFHFDIPLSSHPLAKPPDGNSGILNVKVMGDISEHNVPMPRHMLTLVLNQEKSPNLLSHQGHEAFQPPTKYPMMIYGRNTPILDVPFLYLYPP